MPRMDLARRRIGIMGGTFDPIHHGHLVAASEVADRFALRRGGVRPDRAAVAEGTTSSQRGRGPLPDDGHRDGLQPAVPRQPGRHRPRGADTYTVDTLRDLRAEYGPKAQLYFITGADALEKILSWKDADQIFELAHFIGVTRPGFELTDAHLPADTVSLVQVPAMAISSTDCRARVAAGQAGLVPGARRCGAVHRQATPLPAIILQM